MFHNLYPCFTWEAHAVYGWEDVTKAINLCCRKLFSGATLPSSEMYKPTDYGDGSESGFFKVSILKVFTTGPDRRVQISITRK